MINLRTFTTILGADRVTYQIMAYRKLAEDEAKKKVGLHLAKTAPAQRPKPGDVVIIGTVVGWRSNS